MEKPQIVTINPHNIREEIQSPVVVALLERGYVVESSLILEDPREPEGNRHRLGLILVQRHPEQEPARVSRAAIAAWVIGGFGAACGVVALVLSLA